jgi:hypothetical protein
MRLREAGDDPRELLPGEGPGRDRADIALHVLACIAYGSEMSRERYGDIPVTKPA